MSSVRTSVALDKVGPLLEGRQENPFDLLGPHEVEPQLFLLRRGQALEKNSISLIDPPRSDIQVIRATFDTLGDVVVSGVVPYGTTYDFGVGTPVGRDDLAEPFVLVLSPHGTLQALFNDAEAAGEGAWTTKAESKCASWH